MPLEERQKPRLIDEEFAAFIGEFCEDGVRPGCEVAALGVSYMLGQGHSCMALSSPPAIDRPGADELVQWPDSEDWDRILSASPVVSRGEGNTPLVLDSGRLYLRRFWKMEQELARRLLSLAEAEVGVAPEVLEGAVEKVLGALEGDEADWQAVAAVAATVNRLTIITGGPGTGKTTTVVKALRLLLECAEEPPTIALVAPTGKAAARLKEAVLNGISGKGAPAGFMERLGSAATTMHRLLGWRPTDNSFRHDAEKPLSQDVFVVDESSMVDLSLMSRFFSALPMDARVILLGDPQQLASVDAGTVLADVVEVAGDGFDPNRVPTNVRRRLGLEQSDAVLGKHPLARCHVRLRRNHRFKAESGINRICVAVRAGEAEEARKILTAGESPDLEFILADRAAWREQMVSFAAKRYARLARLKNDPAAALEEMAKFRVLSVLRRGPFGVEELNRLIIDRLHGDGLLLSKTKCAGMPIIIRRNNPALKLYNGDIGVTHPYRRNLLAAFPSEGGDGAREVRSIPLVRLPEWEPGFALTVHQCQGSEFQEVLFVLPDQPSPVLTREAVYTAISRAREKAVLMGDADVIEEAVRLRVQRASGLPEVLRAPATAG